MTEPTLQEQADAQEAQANAPATPAPTPIPEKFQNPDGTLNQDSLLKSYQEIESGQSTPDPSPPTTDPDETTNEESNEEVTTDDLTVTPDKDTQFDPFFQEFERDGQLSEESFTALEKLGVSRQLAEGYIGSNVQLAERQTADLIDAVGGKEQYTQMQAWASQNKTPEENQVFNKAVTGFDADARTDAVESLYTEWAKSNGVTTNTVVAQADSAYNGPAPYKSEAEFRADMKTDAYQNDVEYRRAAHQRANRMYGLQTKTQLA